MCTTALGRTSPDKLVAGCGEQGLLWPALRALPILHQPGLGRGQVSMDLTGAQRKASTALSLPQRWRALPERHLPFF